MNKVVICFQISIFEPLKTTLFFYFVILNEVKHLVDIEDTSLHSLRQVVLLCKFITLLFSSHFASG